mmetsp:Transcript_697/g.1673  ORF Transcript_697/g.1673 Transcript_697/m.1673 type:complete len:221 (-) Transcript_697:862-1524(-)
MPSSCLCMASKLVRKSGRSSAKGTSASWRSFSSSMSGCTKVQQCLCGKNLTRLSRTSRDALARSASPLTRGFASKACSRYWSGVSSVPDSSLSSRTKSLRSHSKAGLLVSFPRSSMCSAMLQTSDKALKSPSFRTPLVLSKNTDDIRRHRDISFASRVLSESVLPKPSQSMKMRASPASRVCSAGDAPHIQRPSVQAFVVDPTRNCEVPPWMRPNSRFRR